MGDSENTQKVISDAAWGYAALANYSLHRTYGDLSDASLKWVRTPVSSRPLGVPPSKSLFSCFQSFGCFVFNICLALSTSGQLRR